jgi:hypothetical protein
MILHYWLAAFTIAMLGLAAWTLLNSPDERWKRQSFFYNYGAFIAYLILALMGILALLELYRTSGVFRLGAFAAMSAPAAALGLSSVYDAYAAKVDYEEITKMMGGESTQETQQQQQQQQQQQDQQKRRDAAFRKPRRQIGYGRYHT